MAFTLNIGRKGQLFVKKEAAFGVAEILAASNAVRHVDVGFSYNPNARRDCAEKKQSPGRAVRLDGRISAGLDLKKALLRPSGTLNTVPECDPFLLAAFGASTGKTADTPLATTINDPAVTATGGILTSVTGLVVGDAIQLTYQAKLYVRFIKTVDGPSKTVSWGPALPGAPTNASPVKQCLTYKLTTDNQNSLTVAHYLENLKRQIVGAVVDKLGLDFDGTEEATIAASGPAAKSIAAASVPAKPGSFTTVGTTCPTGMVGDCYAGDVLLKHKKLSFDLTNGMVLRNSEAGNDGLATEAYRKDYRAVNVSLESFAETQATLYDLVHTGTEVSIFRQNGRTEGKIVAVYAPRVEFEQLPDQDDSDAEVNWSYKGKCLESADGANDELMLALG